MKDDQFIQLLCHNLDQSSQAIAVTTQEKLQAIRHQAVKASGQRTLYPGSTLAIPPIVWREQLVAIIGSLVLISAVATYSAWIHEQNEEDQGFLDAKLLSSDMPLQILANPELSQWLEN
ncbi:MAG: hypothetical protein B7Z60_08000 [Ferrovum sp. 37-45-19]|jgi:hypothetical protein|uniref:DUF3619 family protein n=1 Tax=Ferrovum sp. JA12 TaxID=1356299 RepID=UPI000703657D|nr:DUF3619 family protein [Ferrovum sp. JA12]OYV80070.1 MAG: hypothetical protein B7Z65_02905 [Ferrovum sp. 21-44-67]OYV93609.1 MAG: hypothetical protein B7Z60_08000 [Ferrovum sp. 37-45-19]OZB33496.1 MAG: hypothetical protein B7X47_03835 [Ferrovum sp. 34-44-207]HQT81948.1 DUF3619 family protein [Ferrovaceae bacterium]KRH78012.1 hypothetical protein FERRO_19670 [Ferrovum sp. JA12]